MYKITNKVSSIIAGMTMLLMFSSANAALVEFTLEGDVQGADTGNIFNVAAGDTIFATGFIDDSFLSGGTANVTNLLITVGDLTFDNSVEEFATNLVLDGSGAFLEFNYETNGNASGTVAYFDSFFDTFTGSAFNGPKEKGKNTELSIAGKWDTTTFAVVPVPAAVWLFGSGLLGLVGLARRKTA